MRQFDELTRDFGGADAGLKRFILHQLEGLRVDAEADEVLAFLQQALHREAAWVAAQAQRTLRRFLPRLHASRHRLRQAPSTAMAGTWTEYNIDRAVIASLKRLGAAKNQDFGQIQMEQFHLSALHLLAPATDALLERFPHLPDAGVNAAVAALGHLGTSEAVKALEDRALQSERDVVAVGAALGSCGTSAGLEALIRLIEKTRDPELAAELTAELVAHPSARTLGFLEARLEGASDHVKVATAAALAGFGSLGGGRVLLRLLADPAPYVALWAAHSLSQLSDPGLSHAMERAFGQTEDRRVRRLLVRAIAASKDKKVVEFLKTALGSSDPMIKAAAVEGLVKLHTPEQDLYGMAFRLVSDPNLELSCTALLAAAPVDAGLAVQKIRSLLAGKDAQARQWAVWCLGYVQSETSLNVLRNAIFYDKEESVVVTAVQSLGKYDDPSIIDLLLSLLRHQSRSVRLTVVRVLADIGNRQGARLAFKKVAEQVTYEQDPHVRAGLVRALGRMVDPTQHVVVARSLKDPAEPVVVAAVEALDVLGSIDSIASLEPLAADTRPGVVTQAALALWNQGELRVVKKLADGLQSGDSGRLLGSLDGLCEILASLRQLADSAKYVLLFSELKSNLKTPAFLAFSESRRDLSRRSNPLPESISSFDFRPVVAKEEVSSAKAEPGPASPQDQPGAADRGSPDAPSPETSAATSGQHAKVSHPSPAGMEPLDNEDSMLALDISLTPFESLDVEPIDTAGTGIPMVSTPSGSLRVSGRHQRPPERTPPPVPPVPPPPAAPASGAPLSSRRTGNVPKVPAPQPAAEVPTTPAAALAGRRSTRTPIVAPVPVPAPVEPPPPADAPPGAEDDDLIRVSGAFSADRVVALLGLGTAPAQGPTSSGADPHIRLEELLDLIAAGRTPGAAEALEVLASSGQQPVARLVLAQGLMRHARAEEGASRAGTLQRAREELEKVGRECPDLVEPSLRLAEMMKDVDRAATHKALVAAMKTALRLLGRQIDMAQDLSNAGRVDEMVPVLANLSQQLPMLGQANAMFGETLLRRGDCDGAFAHLQAAHVSEPGNTAVAYMMAVAASRSGRGLVARHLLTSLLARADLEPDLASRARALLRSVGVDPH